MGLPYDGSNLCGCPGSSGGPAKEVSAMRILNLGSLNLDYNYRVDTFLVPGETKLARSFQVRCGGKGLNQSVALASAGAETLHGGLLGSDGAPLLQCLKARGVETELLLPVEEKCGNAMIQVDDRGQNCILLYGGTNQMLTEAVVDRIFEKAGQVDMVVLQNEINLNPYVMERAYALGIPVAFNAAPMSEVVRTYPLDGLSWLIVNEIEGGQLAQCSPEESETILSRLAQAYPGVSILLTLGSQGARCFHRGVSYRCPAVPLQAVDTTAAGDTFIGYFLTEYLRGKEIDRCLHFATAASALCVSSPGASDSIPMRDAVEQYCREDLAQWPWN